MPLHLSRDACMQRLLSRSSRGCSLAPLSACRGCSLAPPLVTIILALRLLDASISLAALLSSMPTCYALCATLAYTPSEHMRLRIQHMRLDGSSSSPLYHHLYTAICSRLYEHLCVGLVCVHLSCRSTLCDHLLLLYSMRASVLLLSLASRNLSQLEHGACDAAHEP